MSFSWRNRAFKPLGWLGDFLSRVTTLVPWALSLPFYVAFLIAGRIAALKFRNLRNPDQEIAFEDWQRMPENERNELRKQEGPHAFHADALEGVRLGVETAFREAYGRIPRLKIHGMTHRFTDWEIHVQHPFIFDSRLLPESFLGYSVYVRWRDLPSEFDVLDRKREYIWDYHRYEQFVDRCSDEIRRTLGKADMTRAEMLDALCYRDFAAWKRQCDQWVAEGKIPPWHGSKGEHP